ncbi:peptidylprolyl isomerase [Chondromyces crocatus]|uniref:peptidylprolyl isomerase n=1 Tax=Chondromyces crocatus TaxID=52 RepID=UPI001470111E|nr:peptidylprolyl isomerase [Chondromyces crocatus]
MTPSAKLVRLAPFLALLALPLGCNTGSNADPAPGDPGATAPATSVTDPTSGALASPAPSDTATISFAGEEAPRVIGASQILIAYKGAQLAPPTVTRSREEARRRAEEILAQLKEGKATLEELARSSSDDSSRAADGAMGNFERGAVPPALADAAFALKVGETSGIVESARGFHVVRRSR